MFIYKNDSPETIKAKLNTWQRNKELEFLNDIEKIVKRHDKRGIEKKRIIRVLEAISSGLTNSIAK